MKYDKLMVAHQALQEKFDALVLQHKDLLRVLQKVEKRQSLTETQLRRPAAPKAPVEHGKAKAASLRSTEKIPRRKTAF